MHILTESDSTGSNCGCTGSINTPALYNGSDGNMETVPVYDTNRRKAVSGYGMYVDLRLRWRDNFRYVTFTTKGNKWIERS